MLRWMTRTRYKGKRDTPSPTGTVLHRFTKPGRVMEIRERKVAQWPSLQVLVFVDGSLLESQMFHGGKEREYPEALATRIAQFVEGGWREQDVTKSSS